MTTRAFALAGLLCLGTAGGMAYVPPAEARTYVDVGIDVAPPAPRYERVVARRGYVWTPGYYRWNETGRQHEWIAGTYVAERPGYVWRPHHWERGPLGHWHFIEGGWRRR